MKSHAISEKLNGSNHDKLYQKYVTRHSFFVVLDAPLLIIMVFFWTSLRFRVKT